MCTQRPLRILSIEDKSKGSSLPEVLQDDFTCQITRVASEADMQAALAQHGIDLVLADDRLKSLNSLTALKLAKKIRPEIPFILVGETLDSEAVLEAFRNGASDYILKTRLADLTAALRRALRGAEEKMERQGGEEDLRRRENYLSEAQKLTHTGSWAWRVADRGALHLSDEWYRIFEFDPAEGMPGWEKRLERIHPDDRAKWKGTIDRAILENADYEMEFRIVLPSGPVRWIHTVAHRLLNAWGEVVQFVGSSTDITERKRAEEALRRSEGYLAEAQRMTRSGSWAWNVRTDELFWSQEMYRIFGFDPETTKVTMSDFFERVHPEDVLSVRERARTESARKDQVDSIGEFRVILPDGRVRHIQSLAHPVSDEFGQVIEVVGTAVDVTEQREAKVALETAFEQINTLKDQLHKENIALREEIDRSSMFEEIVGESPALQAVLAMIMKVARTDSTVLITGETGTGKELVARAIHRKSPREERAFVSVNCAAIPPTLVSSELFGHEKGAFTGATQRRLGRFELAEGGTIFLDEVGELPLETQIALLRILQEREFERVGSSKPIRSNVRVIAATNRELERAVEAGTFRRDLFYRLNVFPMDLPPLRKRREDIPLLVEYFINRYAAKAGKKIRGISATSLDRLTSYTWPGNIRELQNVIERSVIVCDSENLMVDESWLSASPADKPQPATLSRMPPAQEKRAIEDALTESQGRISGPTGAAALLGIPPSTLDSKIKTLGIKKSRFKIA
jgi:PAS domain S-box-containing protein